VDLERAEVVRGVLGAAARAVFEKAKFETRRSHLIHLRLCQGLGWDTPRRFQERTWSSGFDLYTANTTCTRLTLVQPPPHLGDFAKHIARRHLDGHAARRVRAEDERVARLLRGAARHLDGAAVVARPGGPVQRVHAQDPWCE
jgi:hypothetical protein